MRNVDGESYFSFSEVLRRRWTQQQVGFFLGGPDVVAPAPSVHYSRMNLYLASRVREEEALPAWIRSNSDAPEPDAALAAIALAEAALFRVDVEDVPDDELEARAIAYHDTEIDRGRFVKHSLESLKVSCLRHVYSNYAAAVERIKQFAPPTEAREDAIFLVKQRVHATIAERRPDLKEECERQLHEAAEQRDASKRTMRLKAAWSTLALDIGARVSGPVTSIKDYGFYIEIVDGVEGLVHVSDMPWSGKPRNPMAMVSPGEVVEAVVLAVDVREERLSLSMTLATKIEGMTDDSVLAAIEAAVDAVRLEFPNLQEDRVHERSLTHRLAVHLERNALFEKWHVDCEYNRDGFEPKRVQLPSYEENEHDERVLVLPDVIVHHRRQPINLLAIEAKVSMPEPDEGSKGKLAAYRRELGYALTVFVSFDPKVVMRLT